MTAAAFLSVTRFDDKADIWSLRQTSAMEAAGAGVRDPTIHPWDDSVSAAREN
jgi:hypothetical protein